MRNRYLIPLLLTAAILAACQTKRSSPGASLLELPPPASAQEQAKQPHTVSTSSHGETAAGLTASEDAGLGANVEGSAGSQPAMEPGPNHSDVVVPTDLKWIPEDRWTRQAVAGDVALQQQLVFDGIWTELQNSLVSYKFDLGRMPRSLGDLFTQYPLFYSPLTTAGETWPIVDATAGQSPPPGAFVLQFTPEKLDVRFTIGSPGTRDKSYPIDLAQHLHGIPLTATSRRHSGSGNA